MAWGDLLIPPPSVIDLVKDDQSADATWKTWLNTLYETVKENMRRDFYFDVSAGFIDGYSGVNKFGNNATLATSSTETVWDGSTAGTYSFPTTASITHIRSAVDSVITQGVVVEVQGLDTNWDLVVQEITLDGTNSTTEVILTTALRRVFRMKALDDTTLDQDIWVGATGVAAATAKAIITTGNNQTLMAVYTVPAGFTAYMTHYYGSINKDSGGGDPDVVMRLWVQDNDNGYAPQIKHVIGLDEGATSYMQHRFMPYFRVNEKNDIYINCSNLSGTATADVSAGFDLILIEA